MCEIEEKFQIVCNDDKILYCCLHLRARYANNLVGLVTLDMNLQNKGMILGLNSVFSNELLDKWLKA